MHETKILEPLQINGNYPFSQQYFHTQANKIFQFVEKKNLNDNISFFEYLNYLNLHESEYILNLKRKLTELHIF
jgi:hypothetical protein